MARLPVSLPALLLPLLLAATAAAYWPGLGGPLLLDDLSNLSVLVDYEAGRASARDVITGHGAHPLQRPVAMASFLADQVFHGGAVRGLKHTNLMLHLLAGTLLFWLSAVLFRQAGLALGGREWWPALAVAALWLVAPLLVSTVLYTVQRMAQLAALFAFAGLLAYLLGRERLATRPVQGWSLIGLALGACWPLAALSKENGALLPLVLVVIEVFFLRFAGAGAQGRRLKALLAVVTVLPGVLGLVYALAHWDALAAGYANRDFGPLERLLTQARVLVDYLLNLLTLPGGTAFGLYHDGYPVRAGLASAVLLAAWAGLAAMAWRWRRRPLAPLLGGLVFFLAGHLAESTLLPLELYFEHRNYLPAAGVYIGLVAGFTLAAAHQPRLRGLLALVLALMVTMNLGLTFARAQLWATKEGLVAHHLEAHPRSVRAHAAAANLLLGQERYPEALALVEEAAAAAAGSRDESGAALHRLAVLCHAGRPPAPADWPVGPLADAPYTVAALGWLVDALEQGGCPGFALARLRTLLANNPPLSDPGRRRDMMLYRGRLAALADEPRAAARLYLVAHELAPGRSGPALRATALLLAAGEAHEARRVLDQLSPRVASWPPGPRRDYRQLRAAALGAGGGLESRPRRLTTEP